MFNAIKKIPFGLKIFIKRHFSLKTKAKRFFEVFYEYKKFCKGNKRFSCSFSDLFFCLEDKTAKTGFDAHYIYHPAWAARIIKKNNPNKHVDISSILSFSSLVSAFVPVEFYDYRPVELKLRGFSSGQCDLTSLSFADNSIQSLSCMHTVEHIGLGRYGDILDEDGDIKAMKELSRVLAIGGDLLFVVPVGKPKIYFNAHRIYSFEMIKDVFCDLQLHEFSVVLDSGDFVVNANPALVSQQDYACGCFWFKK